ncbi:DUF4233 domain-containing protein [Actinomadura sp. NEAU-AAG7]|uniref:DUF4233 domain-containing protein n=1 Tax=Actinomadura sp. NEAU-AAG7 TaxID=2839640 RepID=UPI001BE48853|nr:DUF4233 domain-containing protein [Actinomadura sp. NEAU-AAG7]MBT2213556.1 DUF4233 domain-containing protein [Actinomadura sp. NEAU-AAG7]
MDASGAGDDTSAGTGGAGTGGLGTGGPGASRARPAGDPVRRLLATVLACEAVVIALAIPVAVAVLDVSGGTAGAVCGGLAVVCLLMAGLLRFSWAVPAGTVLQVLVIATGFMVPTMFFLGALFGALWGTAIWMGRKAREAAAR